MSFLEAGPSPIYIGFGSIVVQDPQALTATIFQAVHTVGVRAIISRGWGDLGGAKGVPPDIFILDNCPHDWLFKHVSCVVHHGGAGTTSAGIAAGKPTVVVPFFGDQPFWGNMITRVGAGPLPIPFKQLTAANLADAIHGALKPDVLLNAEKLGGKFRSENGSQTAARSFHDMSPLDMMGCSLMRERTAVWQLPKSEIRLSAAAATVLRKENLLDFKRLAL